MAQGSIEFEWSRLKSADLRALAARDAIVILPVASTEQHGPHLPTSVDTMLVGEVARRAARKVAASLPVVVAPILWCGLAEHHLAFGGTFSFSFPTYLAVLRDLVSSLKRQGFRRVLLFNGHGGNIAGLDTVATELTRDLGVPVAVGSYWLAIGSQMAAILEDQATVLHACEAETSMMLAIAPELVDTTNLAGAAGPADLDESVFGRQPKRWHSFADLTPNGTIGNPARATAAKGEKLLELAADELAARLADGKLWPAAAR
ncbi:MAG: creatininase family protein [Proteobacteria bacterium]|nr:creatininase family protein [Pseudomonadota bacterium]